MQVLASVKKQEKDLRAQKDAAQLVLEKMVRVRACMHACVRACVRPCFGYTRHRSASESPCGGGWGGPFVWGGIVGVKVRTREGTPRLCMSAAV